MKRSATPRLFAQGKYAEAEPLLEQSLAIQEKTLGPEHPEVALSLHNLAALLDRQVSILAENCPKAASGCFRYFSYVSRALIETNRGFGMQ